MKREVIEAQREQTAMSPAMRRARALLEAHGTSSEPGSLARAIALAEKAAQKDQPHD